MYLGMSFLWRHFFVLGLLLFPAVAVVSAQSDPNPDSPTPILISQPNSTFALTAIKDSATAEKAGKNSPEVFQYGSRVNLYATNIELMIGEDANAFRIYVIDRSGRSYIFPVVGIRPLTKQEWVYEITVDLRDQLKFWNENPTSGVVAMQLAWRGLGSNQVKLALGKMESDLKGKFRFPPDTFSE